MLDWLKPYGRTWKFARLRRKAERLAAQAGPADLAAPLPPMAFVVGCGRSGTTILGKIFARHPQVCYLFEPYHLWAAVDPRCDAINFHSRADPLMLMDARHVTDTTRQRFTRLMRSARQGSDARLLIEKTPYNAMRLGFLEALAPGSRFVHIARDGGNVTRSIAGLAVGNTYRIAGRPTMNQWWGVDHVKWRVLARDGAAAGYFPNEVGQLEDDLSRGAYEWLVSLAEVDRRRAALANRLHEITYPALTLEPDATLQGMCAFLGLDCPTDWLRHAQSVLEPPRSAAGDPIPLPPRMAEAFNRYQARFGFPHRAAPITQTASAEG